ncbi:hypothetical protein ABB37_08579 [Leptomonas pyrrhocoris]|uniref:Uncharacterized protein n=1 Tax=Leptomonas pyrrhocoris TaxID=157538 RepID=A0A0N0VDC6_LEPPY|nr:hypothetical protein ABB37_08579 [Leptomonas pyrrhocoris]KPA75278.1 hypothetical protein ABB37_08579 [Leptomonas pyrrhocoris]|eukprot:XP_015653717.1 hypothetical protein ABB37_08579 [Leptomonas pyrrhocoris]
MYPYPPGLYRPRPDANMMATYHQQQQFYQQQQQQQQRCQWRSIHGTYPVMDQNPNIQGTGYTNYMGQQQQPQQQIYSPHMGGYPMQQQSPLQYGGGFNAPTSRPMNDMNIQQQQQQQQLRPGWAESRPGRTPCKDDWWSHVKDEMQRIESPRGIDLEKEDEHANVMEELQRTGTTSGVVDDGEDGAAAFEERRNQHNESEGAFGANPKEDGGNPPQQPYYDHPQRKPYPSAESGREGASGEEAKAPLETRPNKQCRSSQLAGTEEGWKRKGLESTPYRPYSSKEKNDESQQQQQQQQEGDVTELANSAFHPAGSPGAKNGQAAAGVQRMPRIPPPRRQTAGKGDNAAHNNISSSSGGAPMSTTSAATTATGAVTTTTSPAGTNDTSAGGGNVLPPHRPPLQDEADRSRRMSQSENNAESFKRGDSTMQVDREDPRGQLPSIVIEDRGATVNDDKAAAAVLAWRRGSGSAVDHRGYSIGGVTHLRLSTSEPAHSAEATKVVPPGQKKSVASPVKAGGRDQRAYSYFNNCHTTALREDEEEDNNGSGSDGEDESDSSSSSGDEADDEESDSEDEDDEVEYSTIHRPFGHVNNLGRSTLEYSAFRDIPDEAEHAEGGEVTAANGTLPLPKAPVEARRSPGTDGINPFSGAGGGEVLPHKSAGHLFNLNSSITTRSYSTGIDDRAYMMADMSIIERHNGTHDEEGKMPAPSERSPPPPPRGREYSILALRDEGSPYAAGNPASPLQHHLPSQQTHTPEKETSDPAAKDRKRGDADPSDCVMDRLQRVGVGKRAPPKITIKANTATAPAAVSGSSSPNSNAATAPQTTSTTPTLPNVHKQQPNRDGKQQKSSNDGASAAAKVKIEDIKLPPAGVNERRVPPAGSTSPRVPRSPVDDGKTKSSPTSKEGPLSNTNKLPPTPTTKAPPAASTTAAPAAVPAPKKPPTAQPLMSNTVEISHCDNSGAAPKPLPHASVPGKHVSIFKRIRKGPAAGAQGEKPIKSPTTSSLPAHTTDVAWGAAAAAAAVSAFAASPSDKMAGLGKVKVSSRASLGVAPAAAATPPTSAVGTGKATVSSAGGTSPPIASAVRANLGSSKQTTPKLATPPSDHPAGSPIVEKLSGLTRHAVSPIAAHPPSVFPVKTPSTAAADTTRAPVKSTEGLAKNSTSADAPRGVVSAGATTSESPKGAGLPSSSPGPLQLSSNLLSLTSSTSTGLADVPGEKAEAAAQSASPATTSLNMSPSSIAKDGCESRQGRQQPRPVHARASPSATPLSVAPGSRNIGGRQASTQPAPGASAANANMERLTKLPSKRTGTPSLPLLSVPNSAALNRNTTGASNTDSRISAVRRLSPTASAETNIGSTSPESQHSDGSTSNYVPQLTSTRTTATCRPACRTTMASAGRPSAVALHGLSSPRPPTTTTTTNAHSPSQRKTASVPSATGTTVATAAATAKKGAGGSSARPVPAPTKTPTRSAAALTTTTTAKDNDDDMRDAWMTEAYDFYAYSGQSLSDDEQDTHHNKGPSSPPPPPPAETGNCDTPSAPAPITRRGVKRLSAAAGSLADLGYII